MWFPKVDELLAPYNQVETFEAYLPRKKAVNYNELGGSSGTSRNPRFTKNARIRLLYRNEASGATRGEACTSFIRALKGKP